MSKKIGSRLKSSVSTVEVILTKVPADEFDIECDGIAMGEDQTAAGGDGEATLLVGKRYENAELGAEVLCVVAGPGELTVNGLPLSVREAKALPSSD
jgi:hypothetical protein